MYKYSNPEHTAVNNLSTNTYNITPSSWMWEAYQDWVREGGITEAHDTRTEQEKLQEAMQVKINEITKFNEGADLKPFEYPEGSGVYYKVTDAVLNTIKYCEVLNLTDADPLPINNGAWDNYNGTLSTPMTFGDLKSLYRVGYESPSHNYGALKTHIYTLMQLTTVEAVEAYDYSTGWK